jgi:hypothetical protein
VVGKEMKKMRLCGSDYVWKTGDELWVIPSEWVTKFGGCYEVKSPLYHKPIRFSFDELFSLRDDFTVYVDGLADNYDIRETRGKNYKRKKLQEEI